MLLNIATCHFLELPTLYKTGHSVSMRGKTRLSLFALSICDTQKRRQINQPMAWCLFNSAVILLILRDSYRPKQQEVKRLTTLGQPKTLLITSKYRGIFAERADAGSYLSRARAILRVRRGRGNVFRAVFGLYGFIVVGAFFEFGEGHNRTGLDAINIQVRIILAQQPERDFVGTFA